MVGEMRAYLSHIDQLVTDLTGASGRCIDDLIRSSLNVTDQITQTLALAVERHNRITLRSRDMDVFDAERAGDAVSVGREERRLSCRGNQRPCVVLLHQIDRGLKVDLWKKSTKASLGSREGEEQQGSINARSEKTPRSSNSIGCIGRLNQGRL